MGRLCKELITQKRGNPKRMVEKYETVYKKLIDIEINKKKSLTKKRTEEHESNSLSQKIPVSFWTIKPVSFTLKYLKLGVRFISDKIKKTER
jgi:hypothetical protein